MAILCNYSKNFLSDSFKMSSLAIIRWEAFFKRFLKEFLLRLLLRFFLNFIYMILLKFIHYGINPFRFIRECPQKVRREFLHMFCLIFIQEFLFWFLPQHNLVRFWLRKFLFGCIKKYLTNGISVGVSEKKNIRRYLCQNSFWNIWRHFCTNFRRWWNL